MSIWLVVLVVCFVACRVGWRRHGAFAEGPLEGRRMRGAARRRHRLHGRREGTRSLPPPPAATGEWDASANSKADPVSAPESPVEVLKRDWVAGRISDQEYERGLDEVYAEARWR